MKKRPPVAVAVAATVAAPPLPRARLRVTHRLPPLLKIPTPQPPLPTTQHHLGFPRAQDTADRAGVGDTAGVEAGRLETRGFQRYKGLEAGGGLRVGLWGQEAGPAAGAEIHGISMGFPMLAEADWIP